MTNTIKQVTYDEIPRSVYRRGFVWTWPPGRSQDCYFYVDVDTKWIEEQHPSKWGAHVWDYISRVDPKPRGIHMIKGLDEDCHYVLVNYDIHEQTPDTIETFITKIFTEPKSQYEYSR